MVHSSSLPSVHPTQHAGFQSRTHRHITTRQSTCAKGQLVVRPNKKICVVQVTLLTLFFTPYPKLFFSIFGKTVHLKKKWKARHAFKAVFFIDMNPIALKKAKIVYNSGLSECNRVKRKPIAYNFGLSECKRVKRKPTLFSEDVKIILFAIFSYFFNCQK